MCEAGLTGTLKQAEAVAMALNAPYRVLEVNTPQPWKFFAPHIVFGLPLGVSAPWPKLVISAGRQGALFALKVKQKNPSTKLVHLLNPHTSAEKFDLVVRPAHDEAPQITNLFETLGAPCTVDEGVMEAEMAAWRPKLAPFPLPRLALFLGGPRSKNGWETQKIMALKRQLYKFLEVEKGSLFISTSRRTPKGVLNQLLQNLPPDRVYMWEGMGANPYHAFLGFADAVAVTAESVSMLSEVASLGKPLYSVALEPLPEKLSHFNRKLEEAGISRLFTGSFNTWGYTPLNETARVAAHIKNAKLWV